MTRTGKSRWLGIHSARARAFGPLQKFNADIDDSDPQSRELHPGARSPRRDRSSTSCRPSETQLARLSDRSNPLRWPVDVQCGRIDARCDWLTTSRRRWAYQSRNHNNLLHANCHPSTGLFLWRLADCQRPVLGSDTSDQSFPFRLDDLLDPVWATRNRVSL
jgi:hypothetical protein